METKSSYNFSIPTQGIGIDCTVTVTIKIKGGSVSFEGFDVTPINDTPIIKATPPTYNQQSIYTDRDSNEKGLEEINEVTSLLEASLLKNVPEQFTEYVEEEDVEESTDGSKEETKLYVTGPLEDEIIDAMDKYVIGDRLTNLKQEKTNSYYSFFIQRPNMKRHIRVLYIRRTHSGVVIYIRKECLNATQLKKLNRNEEFVDFYIFHVTKLDNALEILDIAKPGIVDFCISSNLLKSNVSQDYSAPRPKERGFSEFFGEGDPIK